MTGPATPAETGAVVTLRPSPPTAVVVARGRDQGWDVMVVDGRSVVDRASAFAAVAEGCDFPDWFGHNLDALADCLGDLSWRPGDRHLLVWTHAARLDLLDDVTRSGIASVLADVADGERLAVRLLG